MQNRKFINCMNVKEITRQLQPAKKIVCPGIVMNSTSVVAISIQAVSPSLISSLDAVKSSSTGGDSFSRPWLHSRNFWYAGEA